MKKLQKMFPVVGFILLIGCTSTSDESNLTSTAHQTTMKNTQEMPTFVIEREIPGAGKLTTEELKSASQASCAVLKEMGPDIQWLHSYVTENKVYCVYKAHNQELIKEHAQKLGIPANAINQLSTIIDPTTAN